MAMFVKTPNILWRIQNFENVYNKASPAIMFMGQKFHLRFSQFNESGAVKLQLNLEHYTTCEKPTLEFQIDVSVLYSTRDCRYFVRSGKYSLKYNQLCIWTCSLAEYEKTFVKQNLITFLIIITPAGTITSDVFNIKNCVEDNESISSCRLHFLKDIGKLFNNEECSDFTLKCGNASFLVHKAILSARSDYFAAMFRSGMKEANEHIMEIKEIEPDTLEEVLRYLYTGKISQLSMDSLRKVYAAADMLIVKPLKAKCSSFLIGNFTGESERDSGDEAGKRVEESDLDGESEIVQEKSCDATERQLLGDLFMTKEWRIFFEKCPSKAQEMCKPLFM